MIRIEKTLPGELEGDIDPEDYGFEVIREDTPDEEEATVRVGQLYAQVKERTGMIIPPLEPYLTALPEREGGTHRPDDEEGNKGAST
jgi:hypothetical protein